VSLGRIERADELAGSSRVHGALRRAVLYKLALHASAEGESWPAVDRIAEPFGADRRDVQRALRELGQAGEIMCVERGRGVRTDLALPPHPIPRGRSPLSGKGGDSRPSKGGEDTALSTPEKAGETREIPRSK
jgi:hypothetical protein